MDALDYDPATCITAKELRANGVHVDPEVPDEAWIRKDAIVYGTPHVTRDRSITRIRMNATFTAPFRWLSIRAAVETPGAKP